MIPWHRWPWFVLWVAASCLEFLSCAAKDAAADKIKGTPKEKPSDGL